MTTLEEPPAFEETMLMDTIRAVRRDRLASKKQKNNKD